jgi:hypothetical protein
MTSNKGTVLLIVSFVIYTILVGYGLYFHELWGDELQAWNLAKNSGSFTDLLYTIRYEGHPPVWHILLWVISKFTHNAYSIQFLHFILTIAVASVVLFLSPFPKVIRVLIISGYYFLFEYAVISRNYTIGVLFLFLVLWSQSSEIRKKMIFYYLFLFLAANTHVLACIVALSIHIGYTMVQGPSKKSWYHFAGFFIFLPTLFFVFPPSDSSLGLDFWLRKWEIKQLFLFLQIPLKSFLSIPAWWEFHFWDSNFLVEFKAMPTAARYSLIVTVSCLLLSALFYTTWTNAKARYILISCTIITYGLNSIMPMLSMRYAGYFYIGFLCAMWIMYADQSQTLSPTKKIIFCLLLLIQIPRSIYALSKDYELPFSHSSEVAVMYKYIPPQSAIATTYWSVNNLSAFMDQSFYCLETRQKESFIKWDRNLKSFLAESNPYTERLNGYFKKYESKEVYLFATLTSDQMNGKDSLLLTCYDFQLVDKREGAIEPSGNQYLYRITPKASNP